MHVPDRYQNYPPMWREYQARYMGAEIVFSDAAEVNRFGARYRLAKAFRRLELDGYSETISRGYDALTRLILTWTAFETYLKAIDHKGAAIAEISKAMDHTACLAGLHAADPHNRFFIFVAKRLTSRPQQEEVVKFIQGKPCCPITLARAIRHIFVHEGLSASANQAEPLGVETVCTRLAALLMGIMNEGFVTRVTELVDLLDIEPSPPTDDDFPF